MPSNRSGEITISQSPLSSPRTRPSSLSSLPCGAFVPLALYEFFSRIENVYFLFLIGLQCIPEVCIETPIPVFAVPLAVFFFVELGGKLGDAAAAKASKVEPAVEVFEEGRARKIESCQIQPGMILVLRSGAKVPVDCLLVFSSEGDGGVAIEVAGEKQKREAAIVAGDGGAAAAVATVSDGRLRFDRDDSIQPPLFFGSLTPAAGDGEKKMNPSNFLPANAVIRSPSLTLAVALVSAAAGAAALGRRGRVESVARRWMVGMTLVAAGAALVAGAIDAIWQASKNKDGALDRWPGFWDVGMKTFAVSAGGWALLFALT